MAGDRIFDMKNYSSRALIAASCVLAVLLAVSAVMQYRWASLVADEEAQRTMAERESGASSFARDFDQQLTQIYLVL